MAEFLAVEATIENIHGRCLMESYGDVDTGALLRIWSQCAPERGSRVVYGNTDRSIVDTITMTPQPTSVDVDPAIGDLFDLRDPSTKDNWFIAVEVI